MNMPLAVAGRHARDSVDQLPDRQYGLFPHSEHLPQSPREFKQKGFAM